MESNRIGCNTLYPDIDKRRAVGWKFSADKIMEALKKLSEIGYSYVEYSHIYHLTTDDASRISEYAKSIGINSWSCHAAGPNGFDIDSCELSIKANKHCIDISKSIGAKVNVLHIFGNKKDDACYVLDEICRYAIDRDIEIALENSNDMKSMDFILEIIHIIDMPNLGVCVDTGHANLGDLGPERAIRMAGSLLFTTHLQDNMGKLDDHMPPGMGKIDWKDVFHALKDVGYKRTIMLELTDSPTASRIYNQEEEIRTGLMNVRKYLSNI